MDHAESDDIPTPEPTLFKECAFAFQPSSELTPKYIGELSVFVQENAAEVLEPRRKGDLALDKATHIIANSINFEQYSETQARMIPVVTTKWISQCISRDRIVATRPFSPDPRMIFSEVIATCAGLPEMDKESILGACMALGGQESKDVTRMTTHICALSYDDPKVQAGKNRKPDVKVVLPHWFDDCFKLGKRIDEAPYLLPDPAILRAAVEDSYDIPDTTHLNGATSVTPSWVSLPPVEKSARPPSTVFQHKMVMLASDLSITARLSKAIQDIIIYGGGRIVDSVDDCDYYICHYRDGEDYVRAAQSCKYVGNLSWLYQLIVRDEWSDPRHKLLHYPIPRHGIEGLKGLKITVSNYAGESRIYLENLIKACGAEFTKTMKADNTHLITARDSSDKCKAAPEWGISVVNHLWIEESYAKCELRPTSIKKYTHFPPRTDLSEIIGQTFLDESRLKDLFYPGDDASLSPQAKRKRRILEAAQDNAYGQGPAEGLVVGRANKSFGSDSTKERSSKQATTTRSSDFTTPTRSTRIMPGKENETPDTGTGGRSAKAKARDMLQHIAPDIALYEKEKKRQSKGSTTPWGGKRATDMAEKQMTSAKKTSATARLSDDDDEAEIQRPAKKSRPSLPDVEMRVVLTGYTRWQTDTHKESHDRRKLRDLGILIVSQGQPCDYLAAPNIVRTVKFLVGLSRGPTIINCSFIDKVLQSGKVPDVDDYILKDEKHEREHNLNLEKSTARARSNRGKLLAQVPIYCTEKIPNGANTYKEVAEANGAIFKIYRARSGTTIKPTTAEEDGFRPPEPVYLLTGNSHDERQLWPKFKDMAEAGHMAPRIVAPDWLLDVAMAQQVRFDKKFLAEQFWSKDSK